MSYPSEEEIRRIYEEKRRKRRFPGNPRRSITQTQLEFAHDSAAYDQAMYNQEQNKAGSPASTSNTQPAPSGEIPGTTGNSSAPTGGGSSHVPSANQGSPSSSHQPSHGPGEPSRQRDKAKNPEQTSIEDSSGEDASLSDYVSEMFGNSFPIWYPYSSDPTISGLYNAISDSITDSDDRIVLDYFLGAFSEDISPGEIDTLTTLFDVFPLKQSESIVADRREVSIEQKTVIANYLDIPAAQRAVAADIFGVSAAQRLTSAELLDINVSSDDLDNIVFGHLDSDILPIITGLQPQTPDQIRAHAELQTHINGQLRVPARSLTGYLFNRPTSGHLVEANKQIAHSRSDRNPGTIERVGDFLHSVHKDILHPINQSIIQPVSRGLGMISIGLRHPVAAPIALLSGILNEKNWKTLGNIVGDGIDRVKDPFENKPFLPTSEELARQGYLVVGNYAFGGLGSGPYEISIRAEANKYVTQGDEQLTKARNQVHEYGRAFAETDFYLSQAYALYTTAIDVLPAMAVELKPKLDEINELSEIPFGD